MARTPNELPRNLPDRMMRDPLVQPDNLRALVREVAPNIADHLDYSRAEELLKSEDPFWQVLAVARAGQAPTEEFLATLRQALAHLEPLGTQARVRWDQLLRMVLHWAMYRRPHREYQQVREAALDSHSNVELKREVEAMSQLAEKTWEEELKERFLREGKTSGEVIAWREALQTCLRQRFQTLPDELLQRIAAADVEHLKAAFASAFTIQSLDELEL